MRRRILLYCREFRASIPKPLNGLHRRALNVGVSPAVPLRFAIVGSGPAGFYTAAHLLKHLPNIHIDMFEALPVPFGLIRFGVAPDHPEVKNVTHKFAALSADPRFSFYGNVQLSRHVSINDFQENYHATVLAYGASRDRKLELAGEDSLKNVISARAFVNWYNGHPFSQNLQVDLDCEDAIIIGQGNVAIDVARILLAPVDRLKETDICEHALEKLRKSRVRRVHIVGRRGPLQVAFTSKELRELQNLPIRFHMDTALIESEIKIHSALLAKDRPRKRLMDILLKASVQASNGPNDKDLYIDFLLSPTNLVAASPTEPISSVEFVRNTLTGPLESPKAVPTGERVEIKTGLLLRSIGYRSVPVPGLPFDEAKSVVPNDRGRVITDEDSQPGLSPFYVSGWLKRGPTGVIATTMYDAQETATIIMEDVLQAPSLNLPSKRGFEGIKPILEKQDVTWVTFDDWKLIEDVEKQRGGILGKPSEKIIGVEEMLSIVKRGRGAKI